MKLNENKEKIPATLITSYLSEAWDKISIINADLESVKKSYSNTKTFCECLQDLADSYLIMAGRLQSLLEDKVSVKSDSAASVKEDLEIENSDEPLAEDITVTSPTVNIDHFDLNLADPEQFGLEDITDNKEAATDKPNCSTKQSENDFEYTCSFDEPTLTDDDRAIFSRMLNNI